MLKIKIIGAGSAGNHMAFAFKKYNAKITMQDNNLNSLKRSKNKIYLPRYKIWDTNINLIIKDSNKVKYDCIIISSPPDTHLEVLEKNINQSDIFLIEKPICEPNKYTIKKFRNIISFNKYKIFLCGYNHRLFPSTKKFREILQNNKNNFNYLSVNFKENTAGFLKAHSWYKNLSESYLSKQIKGGGSLCEHSHALNLAQYFIGDNSKFQFKIKFIKNFKDKKSFYDSNANIFYKFKNKIIEVNQNFETYPTEKSIVADGKKFFLKLNYNYEKSNDNIIYINKNNNVKKILSFKKNRSDDFGYEADFLYKIIKSKDFNQTKKISKILDANNALKTIEEIYKLIK
jgi:predicted dehydrogenase